MNDPHRNARTTGHRRALTVAGRAKGWPVKRIAVGLGVSERTVVEWLRRHSEGGLVTLADGASAALDPKERPRRTQRGHQGSSARHQDARAGSRGGASCHPIAPGPPQHGAGRDFVHVAIDDATRPAYVGILADENRGPTTGFLLRALRWSGSRGARVERVITENARPMSQTLCRGAAPARQPPHKAERFMQTSLRALACADPSTAR